jgi:glycosyltransferase involved in cell wall biosynthesis
LLRWADVAWFEWCDQLLAAATKLPKTCPIICRLHSYEAFTDMPEQVDWSKVDHLVYVNQSVKEIIGTRIPSIMPTSVVHNGVDLNRFTLPTDKPTTRKIASVGYINYKKNPALLLYSFKKLHEYNPEFSLHIAGEFQDARIQLYIQNFLNRHPLPVYFEGWVDNMAEWYRDKQYVISTSLFESFHYSIAEGMACGVLPLIHDWYGSDYLYPSEFMYGDPDACLELVKRLEKAETAKLRAHNRSFVQSRYDRTTVTAQLSAVLSEVLGRNSRT